MKKVRSTQDDLDGTDFFGWSGVLTGHPRRITGDIRDLTGHPS